jgi:hypothetical protein
MIGLGRLLSTAKQLVMRARDRIRRRRLHRKAIAIDRELDEMGQSLHEAPYPP